MATRASRSPARASMRNPQVRPSASWGTANGTTPMLPTENGSAPNVRSGPDIDDRERTRRENARRFFVEEGGHFVTRAAGDRGGVDVIRVEVGHQYRVDVVPVGSRLGERGNESPLGGETCVHQDRRAGVLHQREVPRTPAAKRFHGEVTQRRAAPARKAGPAFGRPTRRRSGGSGPPRRGKPPLPTGCSR